MEGRRKPDSNKAIRRTESGWEMYARTMVLYGFVVRFHDLIPPNVRIPTLSYILRTLILFTFAALSHDLIFSLGCRKPSEAMIYES
jgi:hypothetical protein